MSPDSAARSSFRYNDKTTPSPPSKSVAATRAKLSQTEFSTAFGISPATRRNWEQGRRQPTGAARVLLRVAAKHPKAVLEAVR